MSDRHWKKEKAKALFEISVIGGSLIGLFSLAVFLQAYYLWEDLNGPRDGWLSYDISSTTWLTRPPRKIADDKTFEQLKKNSKEPLWTIEFDMAVAQKHAELAQQAQGRGFFSRPKKPSTYLVDKKKTPKKKVVDQISRASAAPISAALSQVRENRKKILLHGRSVFHLKDLNSDYSQKEGVSSQKANEYSKGQSANHFDELKGQEQVSTQGYFSEPHYISAFAWARPLGGEPSIEQQTLGGERKESEFRGWYRSTLKDHLPAYFWGEAKGRSAIPLLSENTLKLITKYLGIKIQPGRGILIGRVASRWGVRVPSAKQVYYFDGESVDPLSVKEIDRRKYFVAFNIPAGARVAYASLPEKKQKGAVGFPSMSDAVTFLDLSRPEIKNIRGSVFDTSQQMLKPVESIKIRMLGRKATRTEKRGEFSFADVLTFGEMPVFVEVHPDANGLVHRYQLPVSKKQKLHSLYLISPKQIAAWMSRVGVRLGVGNGIVVGAMPRFAQNRKLLPETEGYSLNGKKFEAVTRSLSKKGYPLGSGEPLEFPGARFVAMRVPQGFVTVRLRSDQGDVAWSQVVPVSPGVVNVIGPY